MSKSTICPLGHKTKLDMIVYKGVLGLPNSLARCEVCGVIFDYNTADFRSKGYSPEMTMRELIDKKRGK